ncbi:IMS domain-containing protein [Microcoleus sp. FACHB-672]|uniref:IMS domain-containing protein n=1 Tax=Microcoleus sp. FACHB-672 TaxID=2692825 RepID=UPI001687E2E2|nr:IMS domain-containing protein [Microcoleus sp. FACHB-672]MBD2039617.1 DUF4101 domain-containing protein [Microcoleus sp. FACHB-672]
MRIPLDYYRILGLPIQATAEQLQQAHRDRSLQLPRREYSEVAILARKQLIDEAYAILSEPDQRQAYDASFLAKTYDLDSKGLGEPPAAGSDSPHSHADLHTPSIEIEDKQFVGALLILQELGEYELVLKLSQPSLSSGRFGLKVGRFGEPQLVGPDIILTVSLACLELGREQWQQGQYENAAVSLETGQELLLKDGLFPNVRGEMQADLYKLRPYRIMELLELSDEYVVERRRGLHLLRDMLQERGGIDGNGTDESGLSVDDFLRFVQQLRSYLTVAEQQSLFEVEARRPSAVATYLAVYALIARGFAQRQPILIRQAKLMLMRLGKRQDVHLEQAICALLLGQTEEASQALELSQEYETLDFIRKQSENAPDLLPGLCLYGERWLQEEVFPHFRDLANQQALLKDYFADERVQAYLESLPAEEEEASNEWFPVTTQLSPTPKKVEAKPLTQWEPVAAIASRANMATLSSASTGPTTVPSALSGSAEPPLVEAQHTPSPALNGSGANLGEPLHSESAATLPLTESNSERRQGRLRPDERARVPVATVPRPAAETEERRGNRSLRGWQRTSGKLLRSVKVERLIGLALVTLIALLVLGFLSARTLGWIADQLSRLSGPALEKDQPFLELRQPPVAIPDPDTNPLATTGPLSDSLAEQVIQKWFTTKAEALGPEHKVEQLEQILTGPALAKWQRWAKEAKEMNAYNEYQQSLNVQSVQMDKNDPNLAKVDAEVSEAAKSFEGGKLTDSRDDKFGVRYNLVRRDGQWLIQDWVVK